jgi:hypothetical protein
MIAYLDKHLVPGARHALRWWSMRLLLAALAIDALTLSPVLAMMPASFREANPLLFDAIQMVLVAAALLARLVKQGHLEKPDDAA